MAAGDNYIPIQPSDRWILDANNNLVGVQSARANGADMRPAQLTDLSAPTGAGLVGADTDGGTLQNVADAAKPLIDYAALRAYTGRATAVHITGVYATVNPDGRCGVFQRTSSDTTSADNGGTVIVDAINRRWKRVYSGNTKVDWFGALGDGLTNDYASVILAQNAVSASGGGALEFTPSKTYYIGTALPMVAGVTYSGAGGRSAIDLTTSPGAKIVSAVSSLFTNTGSTITGVTFDGLWLQSSLGGGHIFDWSNVGIVAKVEVKNCILMQNNAAKAVVNGTASGGVFSIWMHHFEMRYATANSIPAIYIASPTVNGILIDTFTSTGTNAASGTYAIHIESTNASGAGLCNSVKHGTFEVPGGGCVQLLSCYHSSIEDCAVYDLSVVPCKPAYRIAKGATGPSSANCSVIRTRSMFGSAAFPDLQIDLSTAGSSGFLVGESSFAWMDGVSSASGPGITMRGSSAANYENINFLSVGATATGDLSWTATGANTNNFKIWNGYPGNNAGYLCIDENGTHVMGIGGPFNIIGWGGTAAAPAGYLDSGGRVFSKVTVDNNISPAFGASITVDTANGSYFQVVATSNIAFNIAAPASPFAGQRIWIRIKNASGGVLGAITFNAVYKMSAFTSPANGFSRTLEFIYDGTNWVERRSDVDVPN